MAKQLPAQMAAIVIAEPGDPDVLRPAVRPVPRPGPGQVLIAVSHAGVNRPDLLQRQGRYPPPPGAPADIPGLEVAGTVAALGEGVDELLLGSHVCALLPGGGYAEYALAHAGHCLPVPDTLELAEAAALPETLFTVWHNVFERGYARDGETLLVHGGTSGIGTMAIKLARLFDLTVITTSGSDAKCDAAHALGAHHAINYRETDFVEAVREITGGDGVDIVLDMVAGDYTQRNLDCLAADGRLVTIAVMGGAQASVNMARLMVSRHTMTGSTLRPRSDEFKALLAQEIAQNVWPLVAAGGLRPALDRTFALDRAADAHRALEAGDHIGKIVLQT